MLDVTLTNRKTEKVGSDICRSVIESKHSKVHLCRTGRDLFATQDTRGKASDRRCQGRPTVPLCVTGKHTCDKLIK